MKNHKPIFPAGAAALLLCGAASGLFAQDPAKAHPQAIRDADVIAHLNSAVSWFRQVKASDAWALQPADDFYKSSQDDLTGQVLTNAFAYGQAMVGVLAAEPGGAGQKSGDAQGARLATRAAANVQELGDLREEASGLDLRISAASPADRPSLTAQRQGRLPSSQREKQLSQPSSLTRAVSSLALSVGV